MKKFLLVLTLVISAVGMCSCGNDASDTSYNTAEPENTRNDELSIYTIDYETLESTPSVSIISPDEMIDSDLILKEVTANFHEEVCIEEVEELDDSVIVCFNEYKAPMKGVSDKMETAMLDCIAYSLIDNLDFCSKVYFRGSNGNGYVSSNLEIGYDEPYITE